VGGEKLLLDGQAIVIDDYLDVRPERSAEIAELLHDGRLEAGRGTCSLTN
jgi:alpha-mannosidase